MNRNTSSWILRLGSARLGFQKDGQRSTSWHSFSVHGHRRAQPFRSRAGRGRLREIETAYGPSHRDAVPDEIK